MSVCPVIRVGGCRQWSEPLSDLLDRLPQPFYSTQFGGAFLGDGLELLSRMYDESVDLIVTSPPFALRKKKPYGNVDAEEYMKWLHPFAVEMRRILKPTGSLVLHLGGSWEEGRPTRSLYHFEVLLDLCRRVKGGRWFYLAQDFYWLNTARLPSPAQWVTVKRIRVKDAVDVIWWLSKTAAPKADNRKVLWPYADTMRKLISRGTYNLGPRPSGWDISSKFARDNGGAIPPNILPIANTDSNSKYMNGCRDEGLIPHPARYPVDIPAFFIRFLTDEGDVVLDPFGGSNATGEAAETLRRRWVAFEMDESYLFGSRHRFESVDMGVET